MTKPHRSIEIIYDGDCPFCKSYTSLIQLREVCDTVTLTNARESAPARQRARALGFDLNEGFIVTIDGDVFHGAQAVHALAKLTHSGGIFNRINHWLFRSERRSDRLYPLMVMGRNAALKLLRKPPIAH